MSVSVACLRSEIFTVSVSVACLQTRCRRRLSADKSVCVCLTLLLRLEYNFARFRRGGDYQRKLVVKWIWTSKNLFASFWVVPGRCSTSCLYFHRKNVKHKIFLRQKWDFFEIFQNFRLLFQYSYSFQKVRKMQEWTNHVLALSVHADNTLFMNGMIQHNLINQTNITPTTTRKFRTGKWPR